MITNLPRVVADRTAPPVEPAGPDHPMRVVTRQVAFEPGGWTDERRARVADLFDGLAPEWHTRDHPGRDQPLLDALDRGGPFPEPATALEIGSGTGMATGRLAERFTRVVALDLAFEMLRRAPADQAPRVQADADALPLPNLSVDVAVLVNALLFPAELDRILTPAGRLVWVNTRGPHTPIHLSADDVATAMPGRWDGVAAEAGPGTWCVLRRAAQAEPPAQA